MIEVLTFTADESNIGQDRGKVSKGMVVPNQKYRLVCMGGACSDAGTSAIYSHAWSEQDKLKLKNSGAGMMSCKTSCLGPCSLAPVVQVWPESTICGGVSEDDIDSILESHIKNGKPVADLNYPTSGKKQSLK